MFLLGLGQRPRGNGNLPLGCRWGHSQTYLKIGSKSRWRRVADIESRSRTAESQCRENRHRNGAAGTFTIHTTKRAPHLKSSLNWTGNKSRTWGHRRFCPRARSVPPSFLRNNLAVHQDLCLWNSFHITLVIASLKLERSWKTTLPCERYKRGSINETWTTCKPLPDHLPHVMYLVDTPAPADRNETNDDTVILSHTMNSDSAPALTSTPRRRPRIEWPKSLL